MTTTSIVQLHPDDAERVRRQMAEIQRLAALAPGEWLLYADDTAKRLGMSRPELDRAVETIIADREKKAREAQAEQRRAEQRAERKQERKQAREVKEAERKRDRKAKEIERLAQRRARRRDRAALG